MGVIKDIVVAPVIMAILGLLAIAVKDGVMPLLLLHFGLLVITGLTAGYYTRYRMLNRFNLEATNSEPKDDTASQEEAAIVGNLVQNFQQSFQIWIKQIDHLRKDGQVEVEQLANRFSDIMGRQDNAMSIFDNMINAKTVDDDSESLAHLTAEVKNKLEGVTGSIQTVLLSKNEVTDYIKPLTGYIEPLNKAAK